MSFWTYINGTITVKPMGRTQPEKRYILDTVLEHLPRVTGSEGDMEIYVNQRAGHNVSCSCDEFGMRTDNLVAMYGYKSRKRGWHETQDQYLLTVKAGLRDRMFDETKREFLNWLCRLAKRVMVEEVLVNIQGYEQEMLVQDDGNTFYHMFENPSWYTPPKWKEPETNWCEYLMWDRGYETDMPLELVSKYYEDEENDAEVERRRKWREMSDQ